MGGQPRTKDMRGRDRRRRDPVTVIPKDELARPKPRHFAEKARLVGSEPETPPERASEVRKNVACALVSAAAISFAVAVAVGTAAHDARQVSGVNEHGMQTELLQDASPAQEAFSVETTPVSVDAKGRTLLHVTLSNNSDQRRDVTMTLSATMEGADAKGGNWKADAKGIRADADAADVAWHEDRLHVIGVNPHDTRSFDLYPSLENVQVGTAKPARLTNVSLELDQSAPSDPQRRRVDHDHLHCRQYISEDGKDIIVSGEFENTTGQPLDDAKIALWLTDTNLETTGTSEPLGKDAPKGLRVCYVNLGHVMKGQRVQFEEKFPIGDTKASQARVIALVA